jgi:hypothetical protein
LNFAYDDLRDEDLRKLRQVFGYKGVQPIIFDEFPYKKYMVKITAPPQFKYICFDFQDVRLYKGEGSVQLTAFYPYATATFSPSINNSTEGIINNVGDLSAQLKIYYTNAPTSITLKDLKDNELGKITFKTFSFEDGDAYILVDSRTHLIEGLDNTFNKTGNLYNKYIDTGYFFDAPVGRTKIISGTEFYKV